MSCFSDHLTFPPGIPRNRPKWPGIARNCQELPVLKNSKCLFKWMKILFTAEYTSLGQWGFLEIQVESPVDRTRGAFSTKLDILCSFWYLLYSNQQLYLESNYILHPSHQKYNPQYLYFSILLSTNQTQLNHFWPLIYHIQ